MLEPISSNQEAFDKVVSHLLTQNKQCREKGEDVGCRYRLNNLKCAIGALIPDDLYCESIEGIPIDELILDSPVFAELFQKVDKDLLIWLQKVHDHNKPEKWFDGLLQVAINYELKMNVPKT